jgi:hypothetical protein
MNEPARLIPSCDIFAFLQATAAEFLNLPEERKADLTCPSRLGETSIFVVDAPQVVVAFFSEIMVNDPERFARMNRAFDANHVGGNGAGWAVTRFGAALYLSLALGSDIYVKRVPSQISPSALALARQCEKFLDCTVVSHLSEHNRWAMSPALACTLH